MTRLEVPTGKHPLSRLYQWSPDSKGFYGKTDISLRDAVLDAYSHRNEVLINGSLAAGAIGSLKVSTTLVSGLTSIALACGEIANTVGAPLSSSTDVVKRYVPLERELPARSTAVVLTLYCVLPNSANAGVNVTVLPDTA